MFWFKWSRAKKNTQSKSRDMMTETSRDPNPNCMFPVWPMRYIENITTKTPKKSIERKRHSSLQNL